MSHKKTEEASPTADISNDGDLEAFLLDRLARQDQELEVDKIFRALVKLEGSDLHMKVGSPPMVRVKGELRALSRGPIDAEEMVRLLVPMMDERNRKIFREEGGGASEKGRQKAVIVIVNQDPRFRRGGHAGV